MSIIQITAHRGSSQEAPENTIAAINKAISQQADYIELDLQQAKDGTLVIIHDTNLQRLAGINQNVWQLSYNDLKSLDVGSWFSPEFSQEKIPTLSEVLEVTKNKIKLNLEFKIHGYEKNLVPELIKLLGTDFQGVISSFNYQTLLEVKQLNPQLITGLIMSKPLRNFIDLKVDFYSVYVNIVNIDLIQTVHQAGKNVHVWTVNQAEEMKKAIALGVDNIITDTPLLAKKLINSYDTSDK